MPEAKQICTCVLVVVAVIAIGIIALVVSTMKKLESDEVGLKYNTINKHVGETPVFEGLHSGPPGFIFIKFPSVFRTFEYTNLQCLNRDGVEIQLSVSYQYRVRPSNMYEVVMEFKDHNGFKQVLSSIGESAIHDACSRFNTSQFQAERGAFQEELRKRLVFKYDSISCDVTDLQVNDIQRPEGYERVVRSKEEARQDIQVAMQERPQRLTSADTKTQEAETQGGIITDKAKSEARIILNKANSEAAAILNDYKKEAEAYKSLLTASGLNLNTDGFLSYLGIRVIEDSKNPIYINMKAPAKTYWGA